MYLIVGLGNPEKEYGKTRHNMGFNVINRLGEMVGISVTHSKFNGLYGMGEISEEKVILLKPQTYMNCSGDSVIQFKNYYKIPKDKIIVIYDDVDLDISDIRIREKGSSGTHNGMKSIIEVLGTEEFIRVRVGIGKPKQDMDMADYVLGHIPKVEKEILEKSVEIATEAVIKILEEGVDVAMNEFN